MTFADPTLAAPAAPSPPAPASPARALIEGQLAMLTRLAQIGMEIAEGCGRDAAAAPTEAPSGRDPGLAFARVARAVRLTIALQSRLLKDLAALDQADDFAERTRTTRRRLRLSQLSAQAADARIQAQIDAGRRFSGEDAIEAEVERLSSQVFERLIEAEDFEDDLGRPFDAVVAAICADLGLSPEWTARLGAATAPTGRVPASAPARDHPAGPAAPDRAPAPWPEPVLDREPSPEPAWARPWPPPPPPAADLWAVPDD